MASYTWIPGGMTTRKVKIDASGTYTLTTQDTNGCVAVDSITVTAVNATVPTISLSKDSICPTDSATITATGGTYQWLPGGATTSSITVAPGVTTSYSVIVTSPCGTDTISTALVIEPVPVISVIGDTAICKGTLVLSASGGLKYLWTPGGTSSNITVSPA